jgi:hypothetical protein
VCRHGARGGVVWWNAARPRMFARLAALGRRGIPPIAASPARIRMRESLVQDAPRGRGWRQPGFTAVAALRLRRHRRILPSQRRGRRWRLPFPADQLVAIGERVRDSQPWARSLR